MKKSLLFLLVCILIIGCEKLKYGNVVEKNYHPAYTSTISMPIYISNGKTTTVVFVPYFIHHNESWSIDVKGQLKNGDTVSQTFYVDRLCFDTINPGNFICVEGLCDEDTATHKIRKD